MAWVARSVLLTALFLAGCSEPSFVDVPSERTRLIGELLSYQNPREVREMLSRLYPHWEVFEDSGMRPGKTDGRPPNHMFQASIRNYSDLGFTGELRVRFFNDRLVSTTFCPHDLPHYVEVLTARIPEVKTKGKAQIAPFTRVDASETYWKRKCVIWSDVRLDEEMRVWVDKYAQSPKQTGRLAQG